MYCSLIKQKLRGALGGIDSIASDIDGSVDSKSTTKFPAGHFETAPIAFPRNIDRKLCCAASPGCISLIFCIVLHPLATGTRHHEQNHLTGMEKNLNWDSLEIPLVSRGGYLVGASGFVKWLLRLRPLTLLPLAAKSKGALKEKKNHIFPPTSPKLLVLWGEMKHAVSAGWQ